MKNSTRNFLTTHIIQPDQDWNNSISKCHQKYLGVDCEKVFNNINFDELLLFIGSHCYLADKTILHSTESWIDDPNKRYSNAYKVIRHEIKYYITQGISKKELTAIRKSYTRLFDNSEYIKIPYKVQYIFAVVYDILYQFSSEKIFLPSSIAKFKGQLYRTVFYEIPYCAYKAELRIKQNINQHPANRNYLDIQLATKFAEYPFVSKIN